MIEYTREELDRFAPNDEIISELIAANKAGDEEMASELRKRLVMPAVTLLVTLECAGAQWIIDEGWDTSEAERVFGPNWLEREDYDEMAKKLYD